MNLDYHRAVISDEARLDAQVRAIESTVKPGDVVVDLGAGTGVLSLFAARAGASKVYAVERHDVVQIARDVVRANGFEGVIECMQVDATTIELPEKVDVVMGDVIGVLGIDGNILAIYERVVQRYLKPGGHVIPGKIDVFFAPWEAPLLHERVAFWDRGVRGFDFGPARKLASNIPMSEVLPVEGELAPAAKLWELDVADARAQTLGAEHQFEVARDGILSGIGAWFEASLTPQVVIRTNPRSQALVWRQGFLALETPMQVRAGDRLQMSLTATAQPTGVLLGWSGELNRSSGAPLRFRQHEFFGTLYGLHPGAAASTPPG